MEIRINIDQKTLWELSNFLADKKNLYYWKGGSGTEPRRIITIQECNSNIINVGTVVRFEVLLRVEEEWPRDGYHDSPTSRELLDQLFDVLRVFPPEKE